MANCRFCEDYTGELVKYSIRHYAHHRCYLKAGKPLNDLHDWKIVRFPYRLLEEYGLTDDARRAQERIDEARRIRT
jgi:hypothetical protein